MTKEEGNKIIAVFAGERTGYKNRYKDGSEQIIEWFTDFRITADQLKYHSSWDWLMPCVKKWNDLVVSKRQGGPGWTKWQYMTIMLRTEIEPVFNDLVIAIQWYNQNNKPK